MSRLGYWHAHSDLDWYSRSGPIPARPQYPRVYDWQYSPTFEDAAALEARAAVVEAERVAIERRITAANDRDDWPEYDAAEEEFTLADRELAMLRKRIDEL